MARKEESKKKKSSVLGAAVIILALLVLVIVFLVNKDKIIGNFKTFSSNFGKIDNTEKVVSEEKEEKKEEVKTQSEPKKTIKIIELPPVEEKKKEESPIKIVVEQEKPKFEQEKVKEPVEIKKDNEIKKEPEKAAEKTETPKTVEEPKKQEKIEAPVAKTELQLCFIYVNAGGIVERRIVKRSIPKSDSPLTDALKVLIKGPDTTIAEEKNLNTCIPAGLKLLGAKVQNGTAYLDFSEDLGINPDGNDGIKNQLMQIVYTATSFSTVNAVQFRINGKVEEYIGDGIWIGSTLARTSF